MTQLPHPRTANPVDDLVDTPPEVEIANDLVKHGLIAGPAILVLAGAIWGFEGLYSAAFAVAVVLVNFAVAARMLRAGARISPTMLMAAALGGFLLRMGVVVAAVFLVRDQSWIDLTALAITILVTHLGLLTWETRYVSATLAYPGLKPARKGA
jgi:hypothetical protein